MCKWSDSRKRKGVGANSMKGNLMNQFKLSFWAIKRDEAMLEPLTFCHISLFQKCCRVWNTLHPFTGLFLRKHLTWQKSWHWYLFLPSNLPLKTQSVTETAESLPPELFFETKASNVRKYLNHIIQTKNKFQFFTDKLCRKKQYFMTRGMRKLGF